MRRLSSIRRSDSRSMASVAALRRSGMCREMVGLSSFQRRIIRSNRRRVVGSGSVRMKVRRLQKLVPGGGGMEPDQLFLQTANYILHLRLQVNVLQALSKLYKP